MSENVCLFKCIFSCVWIVCSCLLPIFLSRLWSFSPFSFWVLYMFRISSLSVMYTANMFFLFVICLCSCFVSCKYVFFNLANIIDLLLALDTYKPSLHSGYQEFTLFSSNTCMVSYAYIFISDLFGVLMIAGRNVYNFYLFQITVQLY